jgi:hypothetical protein
MKYALLWLHGAVWISALWVWALSNWEWHCLWLAFAMCPVIGLGVTALVIGVTHWRDA